MESLDKLTPSENFEDNIRMGEKSEVLESPKESEEKKGPEAVPVPEEKGSTPPEVIVPPVEEKPEGEPKETPKIEVHPAPTVEPETPPAQDPAIPITRPVEAPKIEEAPTERVVEKLTR